jgi:hypothetical protein
MVDESGSAIPTLTPFMPLSERERRGKKNRDLKTDRKGRKQKVNNTLLF